MVIGVSVRSVAGDSAEGGYETTGDPNRIPSTTARKTVPLPEPRSLNDRAPMRNAKVCIVDDPMNGGEHG
jgi:hypothetical protein